MASSDTRNSFARAVALTGRPRSSRLSISFFLIGPDEPCTNKKYHARSRNTTFILWRRSTARGGSSSDLTGQHLGDKTWLPGMRFGYGAIAGVMNTIAGGRQ